MRSFLKISIIFFVTLTFHVDLYADMLVTNNGREHKGTLLNIDENSIFFSFDGKDNLFDKEDVLRLELTGDPSSSKAPPLEDIADEALIGSLNETGLEEKYQNAGYVKLYSETRIIYTADGECIYTLREIIKVLKERGKDAGVVSLGYKKDVQSAKIEHGRTINEGKVYNYDLSSLRESSMYYRYPDYDRVNTIKFPLPNIVTGSVLDYSYTITQHEISTFEPVFREFYFAANEPVLKKKVVISYPSDSKKIRISSHLMGEAGKDYTFTEEVNGDYTIMTFLKTDIKEIENESYMPAAAMIMPRVIVSISPDFNVITDEFSEKMKDKVVINEAIEKKANELIKDKATMDEKVFNIYDYIVKEISLVSVTPLHYSYLPKGSDTIYEKKAGNYIDKTFLLYTFLKAVGINCEFLIVKNMSEGDVIEENPVLKQFSHPVVMVSLDDKELFLSVTKKFLMITDIDSSIQGGKGLVLSRGGGEIVNIPLVPPDKEKTYNQFVVDLNEDGSINVEETTRMSGNYQGSIRMFQYLPEKKLNKYLEERVHGLYPDSTLTGYKFENLDDMKKIPAMEIKYLIKDYMISAGGQLFAFQLPSLSYYAYGVGKKEREYPLYFGPLMSSNNKYILKLPDNYRIYYIPQKYSYKSDDFLYEASYSVSGNKIVFSDSYKRFISFASKESYFELKKCLETRAELAKEWLVIEKVSTDE